MGVPAGTRFGSYAIGEAIGAGGMGEVYRATDADLKRDVAIKILPQAFVDDADRIARFQREAEMLASLNHPNVAQIYGLERSGSATALVMELVSGPTLADRIAQGPIATNEALEIAMQIIAALEAAHSRGIVHRDLKPANIKIKPDGTVKVLDFGIARPIEARAFSGPSKPELTTPAMTQAGMVLGTAAYMAPEQARGKAVDQRADIWAFGCVLYEMLTGQSAFGGEDVPITLARVLANDTNLGALPASLSPAVRHTLKLCLEKDPRKRIADIRDVRLALQGGFESALRRGAEAPREPWRRALPYAAAVAGGALLAAVAFWSLPSRAPEPAAALSLPVTRFTVPTTAAAPLTSFGGYDLALSPDGRKLAFFTSSSEAGGIVLNLRELDSLEVSSIPGTEVVQSSATLNPFFSADGRWIALLAPGQGLMRYSLDGAPPQQIVDEPEPAFLSGAWGRDDTIIYSSGPRLWRIPASGGTPEPLGSEAEDPSTLRAAPVFLPGERAVLYGEIIGQSESVMVLDLDTGVSRTVVEGGQNPFYLDSGHLVFARGNTLMAVRFDLAGLAVIGNPVAVLTDIRKPAVNNAADFAVAANGTLVYVPAGESDTFGRAVVWVDREGAVSERAIDELIAVARSPRLSPDETRLLLSIGPSNSGQLWIYRLDGRPPIPLTTMADNLSAIWNPDGSEVAFAQVSGAQINVMRRRADTSVLEAQPLRAETLAAVPYDWSSDGELILGMGTFTIDGIRSTPAAATGELRNVVMTEFREFDADLSPDGQWIAYVSDRTGQPEVWVQPYPGGDPERISVGGGYEPRWSVDGRELFYLRGNAMMVVAVATEGEFAPPVQLFGNSSLAVQNSPYIASYDIARDGRFLMLENVTGADADAPASIVVVENWSEEIRERLPDAN